MLDVNKFNLYDFKSLFDLEWEVRNICKNSEYLLGNCSHNQTHFAFDIPQENRFSYLSFQSMNSEGKRYTLRFGFIYVFELKRRVFINELPIEKVQYPEGFDVFTHTSQIDDLVKKETGVDLKEQNNEYFSRF